MDNYEETYSQVPEPHMAESRIKDYGGGNEEKTMRKRGALDLPLLVLTLTILAIGVIMVLSASFARAHYEDGTPMEYFTKQMFFALSGTALMIIVSHIRVATFRKWSMILLALSVLMLLLVPIIGITENGATRWIDLGITTFQPSELAKLAEILAFASMICILKDRMRTFKYGILPFGIVVAVLVGLLYLEPHLSASVIVIAIAVIMMFAGGANAKWFLAGIVVFAIAAYFVLTKFAYATARITAWRDPESDPLGDGFQILQSLYAIGSGGLLGLGLGQSRQKYLYLPEEHNDYIFAIVCEELGFIGAILVLLLFALLIIRGFWIALHAQDRFGSLVVTGISALLAIQVFLNVAVVTNLIPSTGISLPFFSYGGTALWMQLVEMGIILSVSRDIPIVKAG